MNSLLPEVFRFSIKLHEQFLYQADQSPRNQPFSTEMALLSCDWTALPKTLSHF